MDDANPSNSPKGMPLAQKQRADGAVLQSSIETNYFRKNKS